MSGRSLSKRRTFARQVPRPNRGKFARPPLANCKSFHGRSWRAKPLVAQWMQVGTESSGERPCFFLTPPGDTSLCFFQLPSARGQVSCQTRGRLNAHRIHKSYGKRLGSGNWPGALGGTGGKQRQERILWCGRGHLPAATLDRFFQTRSNIYSIASRFYTRLLLGTNVLHWLICPELLHDCRLPLDEHV